MKRSFIKNITAAILILLIAALMLVGCGRASNDTSDNTTPAPTVDKSALNAEIAMEITEQGDYTEDSYKVYTAILEQAKVIASTEDVTQKAVDGMAVALADARQGLTVRPIEQIGDANTSLSLTEGEVKEIRISDYVNVNGLSKITYTAQVNSSAAVLSAISDGKFTVTAGEVEETTSATVTVSVFYDGVKRLSLKLSVEIKNTEVKPSVTLPSPIMDEIVREYDLYLLEDKESIIINIAENISNPDGLVLTYSVTHNGKELTVSGDSFRFDYGKYTDTVSFEVFTVTASFDTDGEKRSVNYTYKLALTDTTAYRLSNGGFENGLDGWTVIGNIGSVSTDKSYWPSDPESLFGYEFGMDGNRMFSAYAPNAEESAVGTLTSSEFTVGGSGFISFKVGAMKDGNYVYIDVVDAQTKEILARYYNGLWAERTDGIKSGCTLVAYKADLSAFMGKRVFFRICDNADSGYGLFFLDSFITYYESEPVGFNDATPVNYEVSGTIYDVFNGGFEMGGNQGWWNIGEPGAVTGADAFFSGVAYGKEGNFLYSGVEDQGAGNGREGNTGVLTSSVFEIGGSGYITYMLGGGNSLCYVQVIDSTTGEILARYRQQAREDAVLKTYVADLTAYIGRSVRIQLVDKATHDWGCVSFDNVRAYHLTKPEGIEAIDVKSELVNGSFENSLDGWTMNITEAGAQNTLGWVRDTEIDEGWYTKNDDRKDGNCLFTFALSADVNCENTKGTLNSSSFVLTKDSYVSFRFGGAGTREVYVQLVAADGTVIATFYNEAEGKVNTEMYAYCYQYTGETTECYFRVVDNSTSNYGCFVVDDFRANLTTRPEGFLDAIVDTEEI